MKNQNALTILAGNLNANETDLKNTLMATICKDMKTDAEFKSFIIVANKYNLNPITKEIYAYPDKKTGGIVPIVSTDGWTRIMKEHPEYKSHSYVFSEVNITMPNAHPCPEWSEITIEKKDGSKIAIREYLREVFRDTLPWRQHPVRMLRHKTKSQGAREVFGFSGIYDKDEAEHILEIQQSEQLPAMPQAIPIAGNPGKETKTPEMPAKNSNLITEKQSKMLYAVALKTKSNEELHEYLSSLGINSTKDILKTQFNKVLEWAEGGPE
jgi:phage recombination protein Bet